MAEQHPSGASSESAIHKELSLKAFAESLYHSERADNYFKFLKNFSEQEQADFLQALLHEVGDAIDQQRTDALMHFVQQAQAQAYRAGQTASPTRPDFADAPFAPFRKPLREATIALFTSAAIYCDGQEPFYPKHLTYEQAVRDVRSALERRASLRVIPADTPVSSLRVGHIAYDIRAAQEDVNVIFPLVRFRELAQEGIIGAVAERNYSFHGLTNIPHLAQETAPQWAQMLKADGVDAVFLIPG